MPSSVIRVIAAARSLLTGERGPVVPNAAPDVAPDVVPVVARALENVVIKMDGPSAAEDPYHLLFRRYLSELDSFSDGTVLEIGSRNRSNVMRRDVCPPHLGYTGLDIVPGENVDMVGDAHMLSRHFAGTRFKAVFSVSVFEHLAMPWLVALEMNKILEPGGLVFVQTHQTWPVHEEPWDFWRFSKHSWRCLFNAHTGFEVLDAVMGLPAAIVPKHLDASTNELWLQPAFMGTAMLARKVGDSNLQWDVSPGSLGIGDYPV
jgi:hypothetical protein